MDEKIKVRIMEVATKAMDEEDCPRRDQDFGQHLFEVLGAETSTVIPIGCKNFDGTADGEHTPCSIFVLTDATRESVEGDELITSIKYLSVKEFLHTFHRDGDDDEARNLIEFAEMLGLEVVVDEKLTNPATQPISLPKISIISNN